MQIAMLWFMMALATAAATDPGLSVEEMFPTLPIVAVMSDNPRCKADSQTVLENLNNSTAWVMQMWDASTRSAVGVLSGSVFQLGDFDSCMEIVQPMRTQYCLVTVFVTPRQAAGGAQHKTTGTVWDRVIYDGDRAKVRRDVLSWALCVPASCSTADLETSINHHLAATERNSSMTTARVAISPLMCQNNRQEEKLTTGATICCIVLVLIVVLVVGGSVLDISCRRFHGEGKESNTVGFFKCFSVLKNFPELALPEGSDQNIDCIYGLRVLSMYLIICDHCLNLFIIGPVSNFDHVEKLYSRLFAVIFYKGDLLVDSFFVISGLLITYVLCLKLDKIKFNPLLAIVLRFLRLTPVYMLVVLFCATLLFHLGDGPLWGHVIGLERCTCSSSWWANLLYINNYVKDDELCMVQSWYLPCVMHFFVIALFVVPVIHKNPKIGVCILGALIFCSILVPFLVTFFGRKDPLLYFYPEFFFAPRLVDTFRSTYTKSHMRSGPYWVGMATGYLLYRTRATKKNYTRIGPLGMALSMLVCCASVMCGAIFYDPKWKYDVLQASVYASIHRIVWAVGICGIIVASVFNKSSFIAAVLSWSPMVPLSKLVYSQFLVHMVIQIVRLASIRSPQSFTLYILFTQTLSDICWSLIISLVLYLSVEAPIRLIFQRILGPRVPAVPETKELERIQESRSSRKPFVESFEPTLILNGENTQEVEVERV